MTKDVSVNRREFVTRYSNKDYNKPMAERFGDKYLSYRREWELSTKGEYLPEFPLEIDIEVIDYCNYKCIMCPRSLNRGTKHRLSFVDFKMVIDEGAINGLKSVSFGIYDEPTLSKELAEMINFASSKVMDIRLSTNGSLLKPELSMQLINNGLTYINFSLDACEPSTYKQIRGGDLIKVEENISNFLKLRADKSLPLIRVSFVAMPENIQEMSEFVKKWLPLVDFVDIQDHIGLRTPDITSYNQDWFSCYQPWQRVAINTFGDISPCCPFRGRQLTMGNIHKNKIKEVWNSTQMNILRKNIMTKQLPEPCKYCYASRVKGVKC